MVSSVRDAVEILLTGDGRQLRSELDKTGAAAKKNLAVAQTSGQKWSASLTKVGVAAVGTGVVVGAALFKAAQAASEADLAQQKLLNTMRNAPQLAGANVKAFNDQADALEKTTVFSHVATTTVQAMLGQYKATQSQILTLTPLVEDFAAKFGIDTTSAAKAVGKALEGTAGGLQRYGIVTGITKKTTDNFNRVMGALRHTVGGFANQEGKTFSGQLAIIKNELKHTEEQIGQGAIPVIRQLGGIVGGAAGGFVHLNDATGGAVGKFAAYGAAALIAGGAVSVVIGGVTKLIGVETLLQAKLGITTVAAGTDAVALDGLAISEEAAGAAALSALGPMALFVAAALAIAGGAKDTRGRVDDVSKSFGDLAGAADKGGTALQAALSKDVTAAIASQKGLQTEVGKSSFKVDEYARILVTKGGLAAAQYAASSGLSADAAFRLGQVLSQLPDIAKLAAQGVDNITHSQELGEQSTHKLNKRMLDGGHYYSTYTLGAYAATKAQQGANQAADDGASAIGQLNSKMLTLEGLQDTLSGKQRSAQENYLRVGDAVATVTQDQTDYNTAVRQHGRNSVEALAALRKTQEDFLGVGDAVATAKQSYLDAAAAQSGYTIGGKNSTRANNDFIYALQKMADTTTGPVHDAIEDELKQLHKIPVDKTTKITADTSGATKSISDFVNSTLIFFSELGVKITGAELLDPSKLLGQHGRTGSNKVRQYGAGGWVDAPAGVAVPAIVHGGEFVMSRDMLRAGTVGGLNVGRLNLRGGARGGDSPPIVKNYFTVHCPNVDGPSVIAALEKQALVGNKPSARVLTNAGRS